jgi:hypothetical protein
MTNWRRQFTLIAASLVVALPVGIYVGSRAEVLTYTSFRVEPSVIPVGEDKVTVYMSVNWNRQGCEVTLRQSVWSADHTTKYSADGIYTARMKDGRRYLPDKPRQIKLPVLPPGNYLLGFDPIEGKCWPWEIGPLSISNTPPEPAPFTVK